MRSIIIVGGILLFTLCESIAQNMNDATKAVAPVATYDRNAISFVYLEDNSINNNDFVIASKRVGVPDKFDLNSVKTSSIGSANNSAAIRQKLMDERIPNQILSQWFSRDSISGKMDMSVIHKRGLYNTTDDEAKRASASKIGMAGLKDAGESLINHSYIFVVSVKELLTMEQVYDKQDVARKIAAELFNKEFSPVTRNKNGWQGELKGYLFKLAFNDSATQVLYNDLWIYEDDDSLMVNLKKARFEAASFPVAFIMEVDGKGEGSQYNPGTYSSPSQQKNKAELFTDLFTSGLKECLFDVERKIIDFQVKTPVYNDNPITAKIGTKESLKIDQRYFVVEFVQDRKGRTKTNRKGVVRAKEVMDNKNNGSGNSSEFSEFYQTAGFDIEPGMLLQQKPEFGLGVSTGLGLIGSIRGPYVKAEFNGSKALTNGPTQVKLFAMAGFDIKGYKIDGKDYSDVEFMRWQVGISKGYYFARNFSIAPFISYGMETATHNDFKSNISSESIGSYVMDFGAYGSINILHNLQAIGTLNLYAPIGSALDKDNEAIKGKSYVKDYFIDRKGLTIDVGLRLEL